MITLLILIPIIGAIIAASSNGALAKRIAVAASLITTIMSGVMYFQYNTTGGGFAFVENLEWIKSAGIGYHVALDGISLPFVVLSALLTLVSVLAS